MDKEQEIIEMYKQGFSYKDILVKSGIKSKQTIMNILDRHGIPRNSVRKQSLPINIIVEEWKNDIFSNSRSIASKFGCSPSTISCILKDNIPKEKINIIKKEKMSNSAVRNRQTVSREDRIKRAKYAAQFVNPIERNARLLKAAAISAQKRKGKPLSEAHKEKLMGRAGRKGELSSNWKGGVSKKQSRAPFWKKAQKACRERDEHTCQSCGITSKEVGQLLDVHHIVSYHSFEDKSKANELSNLISLCRTCHLRVEQNVIPCPSIRQ